MNDPAVTPQQAYLVDKFVFSPAKLDANCLGLESVDHPFHEPEGLRELVSPDHLPGLASSQADALMRSPSSKRRRANSYHQDKDEPSILHLRNFADEP